MLSILRLTYAFLGLNALGTGTAVCIRMATGRAFGAWVKQFLEFSLAAGAIGLVQSVNHIGIPQLLTMLSVYASAFAVLSWHKYGTSDSWGPAIVLSTMCVLCIDSLILISHILKLLTIFDLLSSAQMDPPLLVAMVASVLLFGSISAIALKRIQPHPNDSMMRKAVR